MHHRACVALLLLLAPVALLAGPIAAYEFTEPGADSTIGSYVFGIDFKVNASNLAVSALGYYDAYGDGFLSDHEVGLYDSAGNMLADTLITSASPLSGHFRFESITPVMLLAGETYRVVGVSHLDTYTWQNPGFAAAPQITYLGDSYDSGSTLINPKVVVHNDVPDGFFGPNFQFEVALAPEPATFGLLGSALAVLALALRPRR